MNKEDVKKVSLKIAAVIASLGVAIKLNDLFESDFSEGVLYGYKKCLEALEIPIEVKGKEIYFAGTKIPD